MQVLKGNDGSLPGKRKIKLKLVENQLTDMATRTPPRILDSDNHVQCCGEKKITIADGVNNMETTAP